MPIYEYVCQECGHEFEELARTMRAPTNLDCPNCDSGRARRKLSTFAALEGAASPAPLPLGGCARCGDPNGPCPLQ